MITALLRFVSAIACWSVRLGGVLCCSFVIWSFGSDKAWAEDTLSRLSRALAFESLASLERSNPEWTFAEESMPAWQPLEKGLELGLFPARFGDSDFEVVVLRIDPAEFVFSVYTVSQSGRSLSLGEWASRHGLVAVINASMYLPDGVTSTGYLRAGETINNGRIVSKFGAFFVAEPMESDLPKEKQPVSGTEENGGAEAMQKPGEETIRSSSTQALPLSGEVSGESASADSTASFEAKASLSDTSSVSPLERPVSPLPEADILDRSVDEWESVLPRYRMVVQNYRLISADRRLLWTPGGPRHSIAAVGKDGAGHILFFLCREPLTGVEFGTLLLQLPIDVHVVMYAEGGSQAGLFLDSMLRKQVWMGRHVTDIWTSGNLSAPLPNVIGIRRKF